MNITLFIDLDAIPLSENIEYRHGIGQTAVEVLPLAMHNFLEMADQD